MHHIQSWRKWKEDRREIHDSIKREIQRYHSHPHRHPQDIPNGWHGTTVGFYADSFILCFFWLYVAYQPVGFLPCHAPPPAKARGAHSCSFTSELLMLLPRYSCTFTTVNDVKRFLQFIPFSSLLSQQQSYLSSNTLQSHLLVSLSSYEKPQPSGKPSLWCSGMLAIFPHGDAPLVTGRREQWLWM